MEIVKVVSLQKTKRKTNKYPLKKNKQLQYFADTYHSYSNVIINAADFPPKTLFLSHQPTPSRPHIWHLHAYLPLQTPSLYRSGMTTGCLMQLSAQWHFNTGNINTSVCTFGALCRISADVICTLPPNQWAAASYSSAQSCTIKKSSTSERLSPSSFQREMNHLAEESI